MIQERSLAAARSMVELPRLNLLSSVTPYLQPTNTIERVFSGLPNPNKSKKKKKKKTEEEPGSP
jgi:hypothetical protein